MKNLENITIRDFVSFHSYENGKKYKVVTDEKGNEIGIEVSGRLTTFNIVNTNGYMFKPESYDKFVDDYFIANSLNVPACLYHRGNDVQYNCGKVVEMNKTAEGVDIVVRVPKFAYFYNWIKNAIDEGIIQGFSNYGNADKCWYDEEQDALVIERFQLLHCALVDIPADVTGKFKQVENTKFAGFHEEKNDISEIYDIV